MTNQERALLEDAFRLADKISDGHFTLLKFTTNYRAGFVTPSDRDDISALSEGKSLAEALSAAIGTAKKSN